MVEKAQSQSEIEELRSQIESAEQEKNRLEGQREQHLQVLANFKCDTVEEAREKLREMQKERDELQEEQDEALGEFKKKYALGDGNEEEDDERNS